MLVLASAVKKKTSAGKGLQNGGIGHNVSPVTNGTHCSKSALNGQDAEENDGEIQHVNGHTTGDNTGSVHNQVFVMSLVILVI